MSRSGMAGRRSGQRSAGGNPRATPRRRRGSHGALRSRWGAGGFAAWWLWASCGLWLLGVEALPLVHLATHASLASHEHGAVGTGLHEGGKRQGSLVGHHAQHAHRHGGAHDAGPSHHTHHTHGIAWLIRALGGGHEPRPDQRLDGEHGQHGQHGHGQADGPGHRALDSHSALQAQVRGRAGRAAVRVANAGPRRHGAHSLAHRQVALKAPPLATPSVPPAVLLASMPLGAVPTCPDLWARIALCARGPPPVLIRT